MSICGRDERLPLVFPSTRCHAAPCRSTPAHDFGARLRHSSNRLALTVQSVCAFTRDDRSDFHAGRTIMPKRAGRFLLTRSGCFVVVCLAACKRSEAPPAPPPPVVEVVRAQQRDVPIYRE